MMAPRAMTAAVMGLPNRSQGEAAFLQRQCARVRSGRLAEGRGRARWVSPSSNEGARDRPAGSPSG